MSRSVEDSGALKQSGFSTASRFSAFLFADIGPSRSAILAGAIGLGFALWLFGIPFIIGTSKYWATIGQDQAQALIGWIAYRQDVWRLPLFDVHTLAYPVGTNLVFTDSIPLLALPAKLAGSVLPPGFQYFGYWLVLCYVLQAIGSVALLRAAGERSILATLSAAGFGLTTLIFLRRFPHFSLSAQFLILFTIAAYLMARKQPEAARWQRWLVGLPVVALLVHPYLAAMCGVLAGVGLLDIALRNRRRIQPALTGVLGLVAGGAIVVLCYGVTHGSGLAEAGFGYYSLNLLGPVVPQISGLLPKQPGVLDATGGQGFEGFAYLGSGVLVLAVVAVLHAKPTLRSWMIKYWRMSLALAILTLFAVSNVITAGPLTLVVLPLPHVEVVDWLTGVFRSSGRFFWPAAAVIVLLGVAATMRRFKSVPLILLLLGALALQAVDARLLIGEVRSVVRTPKIEALDSQLWSRLIGETSLVRVEPPHACLRDPTVIEVSYEIQRISATLARPVTTVGAARTAAKCTDSERPLQAREPGVLLVRLDVSRTATLPKDCRRFSVGVVCGEGVAEAFNPPESHGWRQ